MNIDALSIAKMATNLVVGAGSSKIVHTIIKNNVEPEKTLEKLEVAAGSIVLGMMAADASKKFACDKIDKAVTFFKKVHDESKEHSAEKAE